MATTTSKEDLLRQALASKTFNSAAGRGLEEKAGKALRDLPKGIDAALLRRAYLRFAVESPYHLWFSVNRTKPEHFATLSSALVELAETPHGFQARFLLAAMRGAAVAKRFDAFLRAAELVHIASTIDGAGSVGSVPVNAADAAPLKKFVKDPALVAAAQLAVRSANREHDGVYTQGLFWNLVAILAMAADADSIAVIEVRYDMLIEQDDSAVKRLQYALGVSTRPAAAAVARRIETELASRRGTSPVGKWAEALGLSPPDGYWQVSVTIQTGAVRSYGARPEASLKLEALTPPRWGITVRADKARETELHADGSYRNDLKLKVQPKSPLDLKAVLDESAAKLKVRWSPASIDVFMSGFRQGKPLIKKWVADLC